MDYSEAHEILTSLVQGNKPGSDERLPPDCILHQANVLRAILVSMQALETANARAKRRALLPTNVGRNWTGADEEKLRAAYLAQEPLETIASRFGRTVSAIESRLERMGLITEKDRSTRTGFPRPN